LNQVQTQYLNKEKNIRVIELSVIFSFNLLVFFKETTIHLKKKQNLIQNSNNKLQKKQKVFNYLHFIYHDLGNKTT
jgi:hypothetical protein